MQAYSCYAPDNAPVSQSNWQSFTTMWTTFGTLFYVGITYINFQKKKGSTVSLNLIKTFLQGYELPRSRYIMLDSNRL